MRGEGALTGHSGDTGLAGLPPHREHDRQDRLLGWHRAHNVYNCSAIHSGSQEKRPHTAYKTRT